MEKISIVALYERVPTQYWEEELKEDLSDYTEEEIANGDGPDMTLECIRETHKALLIFTDVVINLKDDENVSSKIKLLVKSLIKELNSIHVKYESPFETIERDDLLNFIDLCTYWKLNKTLTDDELGEMNIMW